MMRTEQPAGAVPNKLYLIMDDLADSHGNGDLTCFRRQTYQLHGILKTDLKATFQAVIKNMGEQVALRRHQPQRHGGARALQRNLSRVRHRTQELAKDIGDLLAPQWGDYDVWLDGEQVLTVEKPERGGSEERQPLRHQLRGLARAHLR